MFTLIIQEAKAIQCIGWMPLICGKNKGPVLCFGSEAMKKFQKHICILLFCMLCFIYLNSKLFKYTHYLCKYPSIVFREYLLSSFYVTS